MAQGKKSFILYADWDELIHELSDEQAGELFKIILDYVNDRNPEVKDPMLKIAFIPIKKQLKRDLQKWEDKRKQWSEAGKRSAEVRNAQRKSTTVNDRSTDSTVNVNVPVNDNVNVPVNDISLLEKKIFQFKAELFAEENQAWREGILMSYNLKPEALKQLNKRFNLELSELHPDFVRYRAHFSKWLKNQDLTQYKKPKPYKSITEKL